MAEPTTELGPAPVWRWILAPGVAALGMTFYALAAPHVSAGGAYLPGVLAFACVGAEVLVVSALAPPLAARWLTGLLIPVAAIVGLAAAGDRLPVLAAAAIVTMSLLALGTLIGAVVGRAIEEPGHLLVVAIVSAMVDVFSVTHPSGPTAQLVRIETAVNLLILPWPILGTDRIEPVLGVGDVSFAAIYMVASRRHALPLPRTLIALAIGLSLTLAAVLATGQGVPALPFLGAAVLVAQPRARALPAEDRTKALTGIGLLAALFALLFGLR